jgi:hypothetical protein
MKIDLIPADHAKVDFVVEPPRAAPKYHSEPQSGAPMFHHVKELQFNARVSGPDPRFANLLLEQFGGPNGELKAAMQYFTQAFGMRNSFN